MTLDEAITAIQTAGNKHDAMKIANAVSMESMLLERPYADELAVRHAWHERWGKEPQTLGDAGPRPGTNWTGD